MLLYQNLKLINKEKTQPEYYIYFDEWTGEIISVTSRLKNLNYSVWKTKNPDARKILQGDLNPNKYIIADTLDGYDLVEKEKHFSIRRAENQLSKIPFAEKYNDADINVILYRNDWKMQVVINDQTIHKMTGRKFKKIVNASPDDIERSVVLYITAKNNPYCVLEKITVNSEKLLTQGYEIFDLVDLKTRYINLQEIDIFTRRVFKNYAVKFEDVYNDLTYRSRIRRKRNGYKLEKNTQDYNLKIFSKENNYFLESHIDQDDLILYKDLTLYFVGQTPFDLLGEIKIPKSILELQAAIPLPELDFDINSCTVLTDVNAKNLKIKVEEYEQFSTNQ